MKEKTKELKCPQESNKLSSQAKCTHPRLRQGRRRWDLEHKSHRRDRAKIVTLSQNGLSQNGLSQNGYGGECTNIRGRENEKWENWKTGKREMYSQIPASPKTKQCVHALQSRAEFVFNSRAEKRSLQRLVRDESNVSPEPTKMARHVDTCSTLKLHTST